MGRKSENCIKTPEKNKKKISETCGERESGSLMYNRGFLERRDLEQYFWTDKTVNGILESLKYTFEADARCCLCTPTLAHFWWTEEGEAISLLDIDTRFNYLPKFTCFDLRFPEASDLEPDQNFWRIIVFDPPFFYISMETLFRAVSFICKGQVHKTKLLLGFLKREEKLLLEVFKDFNLKRTTFPLEYTHVKPNKWVNYALYSNIDLPGIKRITK